jgi:hypothetical protein
MSVYWYVEGWDVGCDALWSDRYVVTFWRNLLLPRNGCSTLMLNAVGTYYVNSESSDSSWQIAKLYFSSSWPSSVSKCMLSACSGF